MPKKVFKKKTPKYNNVKCSMVFQNETYYFDSMAEMEYFSILANKVKRFEIDKLDLQPSFELTDSFVIGTDKTKSGKSKIPIMKYTPDFQYFENGKKVVVEVKGMVTTPYKIRLKLFLAIAHKKYGIDTFIEVVKGVETRYDCSSVIEVK